jgi:hypothetical protein
MNDSQPRFISKMWNCGDHCDCNQPQIYLFVPAACGVLGVRDHGYMKIPLWEGKYVSEPEPEEWDGLTSSLIEKAAEYGVPVDDCGFGCLSWEEFWARNG